MSNNPFFRLVFFLLLFVPLPSCARALSCPFIIEVQISGTQVDEDYIKIYNPLDQEIDLSHYQLKKKSSSGKEYSLRVFPTSTVIPAKGEIIWANSKNEYAQSLSAQLKSATSLSNNNSIAFFDKNGKIISALGWGKGANQFFEGVLFPSNPQANQQLKRRRLDKTFQSTNINSEDFYLFPTQETTLASSEIKVQSNDSFSKNNILGSQTPKQFPKKIIVFLTAFSFAIISGFIVITLKEKLL